MSRKLDTLEERARALCFANFIDPDSRIGTEGGQRGHPAWTDYRDAAHKERTAAEQATLATELAAMAVPPQTPEYADAPLTVVGDHEESTIAQMRNCMKVGNVVRGVLCADGHLGYAQSVGGVIAYDGHISVSAHGVEEWLK